MKWDFMYCVEIFGVPVMSVLGMHKATKMKHQALVIMKTCIRMTVPLWTDCNILLQTFMDTTGSAGINFGINDTLYRWILRPYKTELLDMPHSCPSWHEHFLGPISILTWMSPGLCSVTACFGHHLFLSRMGPVSHPLLNNFRTKVFDGPIATTHSLQDCFFIRNVSTRNMCCSLKSHPFTIRNIFQWVDLC
jgi:hypothetical protein